MSPCCCSTGNARRSRRRPHRSSRLAGHEPMLVQDRRIVAAGRRLEAIAEASHAARARSARPDRRRGAGGAWMNSGRRSSMPWVWSAWSWVKSTRVEPLHVGVEQLLAQIRRGVDEHAGLAAGLAAALDQHRAAPAPVLRIGGSQAPQPCATRGTPPDEPQPRMVNVSVMRRPGSRAAPCANRRKKLSVVCARDLASARRPRICASTLAVSTTKAGSLRLPRYGTGAR